MPKMSDREVGFFLDPDSEEYAPPKGEIDKEERVARGVREGLFHIESILRNPKRGVYDGEESKFNGMDPEQLWDQLMHLNDELKQIKDRELRRRFEEQISVMDQIIYRQFIPFIEARINSFGYQNSPLQVQFRSARVVQADDVYEHFMRALREVERFKLSKEQNADYLNELKALQDMFERYRSEATLFTFEDREEKLQKELIDFEDGDFWFGQIKEPGMVLEHDQTEVDNRLKFDLWLAQAHDLVQIADRMLHVNIRTNSMARARGLLDKVEYLKAWYEAPRELATIEAQLKELTYKINHNQGVGANELAQISVRLKSFKDQRLQFEVENIIDKLERLVANLKRKLNGEQIDEDVGILDNDMRGADWAWNMLGISKDATREDLKLVHHRLVLKYHSDPGGDQDPDEKARREEIMKNINEAADFIKRVRGWKNAEN